jgi:hypothetical protein
MSVSLATPPQGVMHDRRVGYLSDVGVTHPRLRSVVSSLIKVALVAVVVAVAVDFLTQPAVAQSTSTAATPPDPSASKSGFEDMLGNLYTVATLILKYVGFASLVLGPVIYFISGSNSGRAQRGLNMTIGGAAMIGLHYGFKAIIGMLKWIAGG